MGKKTLLTLGVGLLASASLLLSCATEAPETTTTPQSVSSGTSVDLSSESIASDTSEASHTYATRLQPKATPDFTVGDQFQVRSYLTVEPEDAELTITSKNTDVAVVEEDGETITIVGPGSTRLQVVSGSRNITLAIKAMTLEQKEIEDFGKQITDNYRIYGYEMYLDQNGEIITYQEGGQTYHAASTLNRILTENYVWDDVFTTNYNAILLTDPASGDVGTYGFDLLNASGSSVSAPESATQIEVQGAVPSAYLTDYFVINSGTLFSIGNFTQEGYLDEETEETKYKFVTASVSLSNNFLKTLYGFDPSKSGYGTTIETFELEYDAEENCLDFLVQYPYAENQLDLDDDDTYETGAAIAFTGSIYIDPELTAIALCDDYIESGNFPSKPDATDVVNKFKTFKDAKNYTMTSTSTLPSYSLLDGTEGLEDAIANFVDQYYYYSVTATFTEEAVLVTYTHGNPDKDAVEKIVSKSGYVNIDGSYYKVSQNKDTGELEIAAEATGTGTYQEAFANPKITEEQTTGGEMADFYAYELVGNINYFSDAVLEDAWFVEGESSEEGTRTFTGKAGQIAMTTVGVAGGDVFFTPASYEGTNVNLAFNETTITMSTAFTNYVMDSNGQYARGTSTYNLEFGSLGTTTNPEIAALLEA